MWGKWYKDHILTEKERFSEWNIECFWQVYAIGYSVH
jgi:hypothetical protein